MPSMPNRPVQHVLRDAAIKALCNALPPDWQFQKRDGDSDYGIDGDVEVFEQGRATGLRFGIQIKGTGAVKGRPSSRIKWSTWNYWRYQDSPVLLVLWEKATDRIHWEWAHRFDTWQLDQETVDFQFLFPRNQTWVGSTAAELAAEIRARRAWADIRAHLPISGVIRGKGSVAGVSVGRLVGRLRERLSDMSDIFEVQREPRRPVWVRVDIDKERTVIWLAGGPSFTIHTDSLESLQTDSIKEIERFTESFTSDLMMGIARHLAGMGALGSAARVASSAIDTASTIALPEVALPVADVLLESQRTDDLVRLITRLQSEPSTEALLHVMVYVHETPPLDSAGRTQITAALRNLVRRQEESMNDSGQAAILAYNTGQLLRQFDPAAAIELYAKAARLDESYRRRSYWWSERAGCLFLLERFDEAADHYGTAAEMGEARVGPLLADALMFNGEYREALDLFTQASESGDLDPPEFRLKWHILDFLVNATGIDHQDRDHDGALAKLDTAADATDLRSVLDLDLLCPEALFEIGRGARELNERSVEYFAAAALFLTHSVPAWCQAIAAAVDEDDTMLHDIGRCARRHSGQAILAEFEANGADPEILEFMEDLFDHIPPEPPHPFVVRMAPPGRSDYEVIELSTGRAAAG